ncbi:hypothetical protein [Polyangium sp. y55x31]|uniref:hypothetical protein n=1 Tax=Polyangium sp. y55x31 TaxID=3042688 RepID=UPI002482BC0D|nr:hypothetical protein [Polyangium sp. y55x31]MDI1479264.1 hypothetical protein [Polyangium sp. y55x31]
MTHADTEHFAREETLASCGTWGMHARTKKLASLDEVLAYENRDVVQRFLESYPIDPADAEALFTETKRWLWLIGQKSKLRGRKRLLVTRPMAALDEMWHCFLLFTQDYVAFCFRFFGQFIHHQPVTLAEKTRTRRRMQRDPEGFTRAFARQMEWQYGFIAEHLGEETLRRWYVELPSKYPMETLQRLNAQSAVAGRQR